jgi:16S rRNA (guanine527-N7)-methyltransferase
VNPALLEPYLEAPLSPIQLAQVETYLDLLLRWNQKTNLTSIRDPEKIATRHFGESFFLATKCVGAGALTCSAPACAIPIFRVLDLGSGAGFPAIPLKILRPDVTITLIEAHHTKAVFLREVLRALRLEANSEVKNVRAETLLPASADIVTLRAVERFDNILPIAANLVRSSKEPGCPTNPVVGHVRRYVGASDHEPGHPTQSAFGSGGFHGLALLISTAQIVQAQKILPNWRFQPPIPIPNSQNRVIQLVEPSE